MESGSTSYQFEAHVNQLSERKCVFKCWYKLQPNTLRRLITIMRLLSSLLSDVGFNELMYTPIDPRIGSIEVKLSAEPIPTNILNHQFGLVI